MVLSVGGGVHLIKLTMSKQRGDVSDMLICFNQRIWPCLKSLTGQNSNTVKILKIGTPEIIAIIVLQLEQLDFTVQYCVQKMQTE